MFEMSLITGANNENKTSDMFKNVKEIFNTAQITLADGFQILRSSINAFCLFIRRRTRLLES